MYAALWARCLLHEWPSHGANVQDQNPSLPKYSTHQLFQQRIIWNDRLVSMVRRSQQSSSPSSPHSQRQRPFSRLVTSPIPKMIPLDDPVPTSSSSSSSSSSSFPPSSSSSSSSFSNTSPFYANVNSPVSSTSMSSASHSQYQSFNSLANINQSNNNNNLSSRTSSPWPEKAEKKRKTNHKLTEDEHSNSLQSPVPLARKSQTFRLASQLAEQPDLSNIHVNKSKVKSSKVGKGVKGGNRVDKQTGAKIERNEVTVVKVVKPRMTRKRKAKHQPRKVPPSDREMRVNRKKTQSYLDESSNNHVLATLYPSRSIRSRS